MSNNNYRNYHQEPVYRSILIQPINNNTITTTTTTTTASTTSTTTTTTKNDNNNYLKNIDNIIKQQQDNSNNFTCKLLNSFYPLSSNHFIINENDLLNVIELINNTFNNNGLTIVNIKPLKGVIRIKNDNNKMDIKICFLKSINNSNKIICEFNRMNGCSCQFHRDYLKTIIATSDYLDNNDIDTKLISSKLQLLETRLSCFPKGIQTC